MGFVTFHWDLYFYFYPIGTSQRYMKSSPVSLCGANPKVSFNVKIKFSKTGKW